MAGQIDQDVQQPGYAGLPKCSMWEEATRYKQERPCKDAAEVFAVERRHADDDDLVGFSSVVAIGVEEDVTAEV